MGYSYKAILNKDSRKNKSGRHSIYIRVTVDRQSKYFNLGEKVDEKYWTGRENRWVRDNHPFAFELNALIRKRIELLHKFELRQKLFGNGLSLQGIADHFRRKVDPHCFNEYVDEFMRSGLRGKSLNTIKKYKTFVRYLDEFNPKLGFDQLSESLFQSFATWLERKGMIGVTVYKYFDPFKVIVKQAIKDGYLEKDPFAFVDLGIRPTKGKRVYLEIDEIAKLKNADVPASRPDLVAARDYWLFCFYASFYYSDLRSLQWQDVKKTESGYCIVGARYKNENSFIAPIHKFPNALEILEKQKEKSEHLVFPEAISEQKYNAKLKELARLAGINKNLMNKSARHSAIQFWESQGLETQHMAKMAGHTQESTTKEYYELSVRDINARVDRFDFSTLDI